jgi:hypothetical protein
MGNGPLAQPQCTAPILDSTARGVLHPGCEPSPEARRRGAAGHAFAAAACAAGFSTIGRLTSADSTPNRIESHHTTS